jgi:hypothetical protein
MVSKNGANGVWMAYDVAKKKKAKIIDPKAKQLKNKMWAVTGKSALSGNTMYALVGKAKPTI